MATFVAFDTETTGLVTNHHEAIEIGACLLQPGTFVPTTEKCNILLKIEHPDRVSPGVLGVHNHYDETRWKDAHGQLEGWTMFCDWLFKVGGMGADRCILVGQNIVGFDMPLLQHWTSQFALRPQVSYHCEDLLYNFLILKRRLGQQSSKGRHSLKEIAQFFGIENPQAHSAMDDANTTGACFALCEAYSNALVDHGRLDHPVLLNEAWRRIGFPRTTGPPPPIRT